MTDSAANRYLCFDYGLSYIGVAIGQTVTGSASPLKPLKAKDGIPNWDQIKQLVDEWQPDGFLVGRPLNMDGTESEMSKRANKFANRLHGRFGPPAFLQDERLSSFEAKGLLMSKNPGNRDFKAQEIDSVAAVLIFESWQNNSAN